jgi:hypothetical protein
MYRIRPLKMILGEEFQELERQEIYFSPFDEQNDPLEGTIDMFWQGDIIVWENLLRHYLLCLSNKFLIAILSNDSSDFLKDKKIPIWMTTKDFPFTQIKEYFFSKQEIIALLKFLSNRKILIRRNELLFHLRQINFIALNSIMSVYIENGLYENSKIFSFLQTHKTKIIEYISALENIEEAMIEKFFKVDDSILEQNVININYILKDFLNNKLLYLLLYFPKDYLLLIYELVYKKWYISCFMSSCNNASIWANYGENHKGVCLKFKAHNENNQLYLPIECPIGFNLDGKIIGTSKMLFEKIEYGNDIVQVDFFRSLLTIPKQTLYKEWYTNETGKRSVCADVLERLNIGEKEQSEYWNKLIKIATSKTTDWKEEKEYRLILTPMSIDFSNKKDRLFKYNFNDLDGLIFGIRTPIEDKIKIIEILERKCKEHCRKDFKLYQAGYDHEKKEMTIDECKMLHLTIGGST